MELRAWVNIVRIEFLLAGGGGRCVHTECSARQL